MAATVLLNTMSSYRREPRLSTPVVVFLILLALLLIVGGFGFIIYITSVQYTDSIHTTATIQVQSTQHTQQTVQARAQETAATLSTAQVIIYATATAQANESATATATIDSATATASAFGDLYSQVTGGTPTLDDPLSDNTGPGNWDEESPPTHTGCTFMDDGYHALEAKQGYFQPCFAHAMTFVNFAYQVSMTINQGFRGQGGILFRANSTNNTYYFFHISIDGTYALDVYATVSHTGNVEARTLAQGLTTAITTGLGSSNQLAVIAKGKQLYLYVNGQYVNQVVDSTVSSGEIGVAVLDTNAPVDALFSDAKVWKV
jgi:hypothetical protein